MMDSSYPPIVNLSDSPELKSVRYNDSDSLVTKVGILPYYRDEDSKLYFLIAKPKPVRNPTDSVPFAMARGTRQVNYNGKMVDIRNDKIIEYAKQNPKNIEPVWQTALSEAEEELGLKSDNISIMYDIGVLRYKDYGIHFFMANVNDMHNLIRAIDSEKVCWKTKVSIDKMVQNKTFNNNYKDLLNAIINEITH